MHSTTCSSFVIVYGFNPLTPLNLILLFVDERGCFGGKKKAELAGSLHENARLQIEKNGHYLTQVIEGRRCVIFEPEDWIWLHI